MADDLETIEGCLRIEIAGLVRQVNGLRNETEHLIRQRDVARASHEAQARNTAAFSEEAADLYAALSTLVMQRDGHFHTAQAWSDARDLLARIKPLVRKEPEQSREGETNG